MSGPVLFIGGPWHGTMREVPPSSAAVCWPTGAPVTPPAEGDDLYVGHRLHLDGDGARYVQTVYVFSGESSRAALVMRAREALLVWYFRQGQRFELPLPDGSLG